MEYEIRNKIKCSTTERLHGSITIRNAKYRLRLKRPFYKAKRLKDRKALQYGSRKAQLYGSRKTQDMVAARLNDIVAARRM